MLVSYAIFWSGYFKNLDIDNSMIFDNSIRSNSTKYLLENDANNQSIKNEAFNKLIEMIKEDAQFDSSMDESELKQRKSNPIDDEL